MKQKKPKKHTEPAEALPLSNFREEDFPDIEKELDRVPSTECSECSENLARPYPFSVASNWQWEDERQPPRKTNADQSRNGKDLR